MLRSNKVAQRKLKNWLHIHMGGLCRIPCGRTQSNRLFFGKKIVMHKRNGSANQLVPFKCYFSKGNNNIRCNVKTEVNLIHNIGSQRLMRQSTQFLLQRLHVVVLGDAIGEVSIRVSQDSFPSNSGIFHAYILFVASITIVLFT